MTTEVSVVIPAFNHAKYIGDAIRSVLACEGVVARLIVVDDGSTDETAAIVRSFRDIEYVWQANQGAHAAINLGVSLASTEYVAVLNDDDVYLPNHLQRGLLRLQDQKADLHLSRPLMFGNGQKLRAMQIHDLHAQSAVARLGGGLALLEQNWFVSTSALVFTREIWSEVSGFRDYELAHDVDFVIRCLAAGNVSVDMDPTWCYRSHGANASSGISEAQRILELTRILEPVLDGVVQVGGDEWRTRLSASRHSGA